MTVQTVLGLKLFLENMGNGTLPNNPAIRGMTKKVKIKYTAI
jgi:ribosomal protein L30/L7E